MTVEVDALGNVASARAETTEGLLPELGPCVSQVALGGRFAPPEAGATTLKIPVVFLREP